MLKNPLSTPRLSGEVAPEVAIRDDPTGRIYTARISPFLRMNFNAHNFPHNRTMPSLTSYTSSHNPKAPSPNGTSNPQSHTDSRSTSPVRAPPYSPITPTLSSARLATSTSSSNNPPQQRYMHSQAPQTAIPQPKPIPIVPFDENPDVLALKSAASILQIQAKNAVRDIQSLQRIKLRASEDPAAFVKALEAGEIRTRGDPIFKPGEADDDVDEEVKTEGGAEVREKWEPFPTIQNVVRCPPINWTQYAIVGDSLDKLHKDQVERPSEGVPQRVGSDGQLVTGGEGVRRQAGLGIAAPYQVGQDKIEKMGTRKGGKR